MRPLPRIVLSILAWAWSVPPFLTAGDVPPNPLERPGWVLDAHDEFDGPEMNAGLWLPRYLESRTERERATARYEFCEGNLVLFVDGASKGYWRDGPAEMTISGIQTGDRTRLHRDKDLIHHEIPTTLKYAPHQGWLEIRARLPAGAQAAFWTAGIKDESTQAGEVDIFESINGKPRLLKFCMHTWGDRNLTYQSLRPELAFDSTSGFHIYALEWNDDACVLHIDNQRIMALAKAPAYPSVVLLTLYGNTRDPQRREFVIDYFRVYQRVGRPLTVGTDAFR